MLAAAGLIGGLLLNQACAAPATATLGLPPFAAPADNPITPAKDALGRKLFFDRRLSPNRTMSCAMCHIPEQGFTAHELATAVGIEGRSVRRNSPTVLNVGWQARLFHDGREISLENQIWGPLLARNEMGNPSIGYVIERIRALPDYAGLFEAAYEGKAVSAQRIGAALASYERTLVAGDSRFDRWRYGGETNALSATEKLGFELFTGKARCIACHSVGEKNALFADQGFHNTGIGWRHSYQVPERTRVEIAPGVFTELDQRTIASFSEPPLKDVGRYEITLDPKDRWAYKTPSLRNVALTAPYMHDGSLATLEAVIAFYDRGGIDNPGKSALLAPLGLDGAEKAALAAFLRALTGSGAEALLAREAQAPIGQ
jgi:cytochrome c peroxidase